MSPVHLDKLESAIRLAAAYNEAFNRKDPESVGSLLDENCVFEEPGPAPEGTVYRGKDAVLGFLTDYLNNHIDVKREPEEVIGYGKRCIFRWKLNWKKEDGIIMQIRGVDIFLEKNGLIAEKLTYIKT